MYTVLFCKTRQVMVLLIVNYCTLVTYWNYTNIHVNLSTILLPRFYFVFHHYFEECYSDCLSPWLLEEKSIIVVCSLEVMLTKSKAQSSSVMDFTTLSLKPPFFRKTHFKHLRLHGHFLWSGQAFHLWCIPRRHLPHFR